MLFFKGFFVVSILILVFSYGFLNISFCSMVFEDWHLQGFSMISRKELE